MGAFEAVSAESALAALVVVGVVAVGGVTLLGGGGETTAVDQVPSGVDTVVRVDLTITDDRATQLLAVASGASLPGGDAGNVSQLRATVEDRTGVDPGPARELVLFGTLNDSTTETTDAGVILHTDAATETAVAGIRNATGGEYTERTVNGQPVYAPATRDGRWIGVLGEGEVVVGTRAAVSDTINVTAGDADAFDGPLRTAYDDTTNGTVRFATTSPDVLLPPEAGFVTNVQLYRDLQTVGGTYYIRSGRTGVELRLRANSAANARSVAQATNGTVAVLPTYVENETAAEAVQSVEVRQQGSTVTVTYDAPAGEFQRLLGYLYGAGR